MNKLVIAAYPLLALIAGCAGTEEQDGIDDNFLSDGKSDAFGISETSPEAVAVLGMLRTATLPDLDNTAMLSSTAAKSIIRHRQGGDRKDGTADDDPIDTLTELDAIPYVGPMAFRLLLDHARATGAVPSADPYDPEFCKGDWALTMAQIRATIPAGAQAVHITTQSGGFRARNRVCVTPDNCPEWVPGSVQDMFTHDGTTAAPLMIPATGFDGQLYVTLDAAGIPAVIVGAELAGASPKWLTMECATETMPTDEDAPLTLNKCSMFFDDKLLFGLTGTTQGEVVIGTKCARTMFTFSDGYKQRQIVSFARY
jgi:hypothetical protein